MRLASTAPFLAALGAPACGGGPPPPTREAAAPPASAAVPADSLALKLSTGTELWFTLARTDRDSGGTSCTERTIEIRDGARRTPIPLLYTREPPRPVNESTVAARLWTHCRPGAEYRVNLHTGQPVRAAP